MEANFNPFVRYAGRIFYEQMTSQTRRAPDCRVFFIHRGRGEVQSAGQSHSLLPGTIVYIPADTSYRFVGAQDLQITAVNFDFKAGTQDRAHFLNLRNLFKCFWNKLLTAETGFYRHNKHKVKTAHKRLKHKCGSAGLYGHTCFFA